MTEERARPRTELLLDLLHESYDRFAWHGPNLRQALQGVDRSQANWRPTAPGAWNIHEVTMHAGRVMRYCGADLASSALPPSEDGVDGFPLPDLRNDQEWEGVLASLHRSFEELCRRVSAIVPATLEGPSRSRAYDRQWTLVNHVYGVAFHNVYHAAQIVALRKQQGTWAR